ncbi:hypothetical protein DFH06DRAFT_1289584 [Mycena polygramma]|nr:hypothetical protein DFH06DRAFT_1289584 [Mycena polygramma]
MYSTLIPGSLLAPSSWPKATKRQRMVWHRVGFPGAKAETRPAERERAREHKRVSLLPTLIYKTTAHRCSSAVGFRQSQTPLGDFPATFEGASDGISLKKLTSLGNSTIWGVPSSLSAREGREFVMKARIKDLCPKRDIPGYESLFGG